MSVPSTGLSHHELRGQKPLTVTVTTAQKLSGLGNTKIWELIKTQKLKTVSIGRRRLIVFASLEHLLSPEADTA
jgi:hypothetical protein